MTEVERLQQLVGELQQEVARLRDENADLRSGGASGSLRAEAYVAELCDGERSAPGSDFDVKTPGGLTIEVKYSALQDVRQGGPTGTRRWTWTKIFGESGKKRFDRLLLVGDPDPRFLGSYLEHPQPYVMFEMSFWDAVRLLHGIKPGSSGQLTVTTDPQAVRSEVGVRLYRDFQMGRSGLIGLYRSRPIPGAGSLLKAFP